MGRSSRQAVSDISEQREREREREVERGRERGREGGRKGERKGDGEKKRDPFLFIP